MRRVPAVSSSVSVFVGLLAASVAFTAARDASAEECPPGSWFCANVAVPPPGGAVGGGDTAKKKDDAKKDDKRVVEDGGDTAKARAPGGGTETTITTIGDDGKPTTIVVRSGEKTAAPPPPPPPPPPPRATQRHKVYTYEPPPPARRRFVPEWGINAHLQGAALGDRQERSQEAKMGGLGFALRARPWGHFAFDFGIDFLSGIDFQGNRREEVPFSISSLFFVNPRSKVQVYFLGGLNWSSARVHLPEGPVAQYGYFGAQGGAGLEFRFSRRMAMNLDALGFIRGRTDQAARTNPEFVDPATGRATNTSGGGLFRLGLTAYWH